MEKPELFEFTTSNGLTAWALVREILTYGFVIFDATRPQARTFEDAVNGMLKTRGIRVIHLMGSPVWPLHYFLDPDGRYDPWQFRGWVEEYCEQRRVEEELRRNWVK